MRKEEWVPGIKTFFDEIVKTKDTIDVLFQVESREASGDLIYDVGYFYSTRTGTKTEKSYGKMVNVFRRIKDMNGNVSWKFVVDMSTGAPKSAFIGGSNILTRNYRSVN